MLFELAIIRLLMETSEPWKDVKAVYSEYNIAHLLIKRRSEQIWPNKILYVIPKLVYIEWNVKQEQEILNLIRYDFYNVNNHPLEL